jgi:hypothetical protein
MACFTFKLVVNGPGVNRSLSRARLGQSKGGTVGGGAVSLWAARLLGGASGTTHFRLVFEVFIS